MAGNVFISHAFGLNDFEGAERTEVFQALADQDIHIVSSIPISRERFLPLKITKLWGCCSLVCDNIYDSWSSLGDGSLQETARFHFEYLLAINQVIAFFQVCFLGYHFLSEEPK